MLIRDDYGAAVSICGYAAIWGSLSDPFSDGHREFIDRRAFDSILSGGQATVRCLAHHDDGMDLGEAVVWADATGLAFRSAPLTASTQNSAILDSIVAGGVRGVSWSGKSDMSPRETFQGMRVSRTQRVVHVDHVGPVGNPQYSAPGCWATCEDIYCLPHHLQTLAEHWEMGRPKGTALHREVEAKLAAGRRPATAATARPASAGARRSEALAAISDEEALIPPGNISLEEWLDFGRSCAHGARWMRST